MSRIRAALVATLAASLLIASRKRRRSPRDLAHDAAGRAKNTPERVRRRFRR